jgi:cytochrome c
MAQRCTAWRRLVMSSMAALAIGAGATVGRCEQPSSTRVHEGRGIALRACAGCHAVGDAGASPDPLAPPFRSLTLRFPRGDLGKRLKAVSARGHSNMPPIYMTPDERRALAAYIRDLSSRKGAQKATI